MNKKLFGELVKRVTQMNDILSGKRKASRTFTVDTVATETRRTRLRTPRSR
jgi:hypothetical protein